MVYNKTTPHIIQRTRALTMQKAKSKNKHSTPLSYPCHYLTPTYQRTRIVDRVRTFFVPFSPNSKTHNLPLFYKQCLKSLPRTSRTGKRGGARKYLILCMYVSKVKIQRMLGISPMHAIRSRHILNKRRPWLARSGKSRSRLGFISDDRTA